MPNPLSAKQLERLPPINLAGAMRTVESQVHGERSLVSDNPRPIDLWKDLTRVFSGKELNEQIVLRCEGFGVDCSKVRTSLKLKPKVKREFSYDSACEILAMHFLESLSGQIPDARYNIAIEELAEELQQTVENWIASHPEFEEP